MALQIKKHPTNPHIRRKMLIGKKPAPSSTDKKRLIRKTIKSIDRLTRSEVVGAGVAPAFLSSFYDDLLAGKRSSRGMKNVLAYLDMMPSMKKLHFQQLRDSIDGIETKEIAELVKALLMRIKDMVIAEAHVAGDFLRERHDMGNPIAMELIFYIFSFYFEGSTSIPKDDRAFWQRNGKELASYLRSLKAPATMQWFLVMLEVNYKIVPEAFAGMRNSIADLLVHKVQELTFMFADNFDRAVAVEPLENLMSFAKTIVENPDMGVSNVNRDRVATAMNQITDFISFRETNFDVGEVDPWLIASLLKKVYYNEDIDNELANALIKQRTGMSANYFFKRISNLLSLLHAELWLCIYHQIHIVPAEQTQHNISQLEQIEGGFYDWFFKRSDPAPKKDDVTNSDDVDEPPVRNSTGGKGKEEETPESRNRDALMDEFRRLRQKRRQEDKEDFESRAREEFNYYSAQFQSEESLIAEKKRLMEAIAKQKSLELPRLQEIRELQWMTQSDNTDLAVSFEQYARERQASDVQNQMVARRRTQQSLVVKQISEARGVLANTSLGMQEAFDIEIDIITTERRQLEYFLNNIIETRLAEMQLRVNKATREKAFTIIALLGIGMLLYGIYTINSTMSMNYTTNLLKIEESAMQNGCYAYYELLRNKLLATSSDIALLNGIPSGQVFQRLSLEVTRSMSKMYVSYLENYTKNSILSLIANFQNMISDYQSALKGLQQETAVILDYIKSNPDAFKVQGVAYETFNAALAKAVDLINRATDTNLVPLPGVTMEKFGEQRVELMNQAIAAMREAFTIANNHILMRPVQEFVKGWQTHAMTIMATVGHGMAWAGSFVYSYLASSGNAPSAATAVNPIELLRVAGPGGRSDAWLEALKHTGTAAISVGVFSTGMVLALVFHTARFWARLDITHARPDQLAAEFIATLFGVLSQYWLLMWADVAEASKSQYALAGGWMSLILSAAILFIPFLGVGGILLQGAIKLKDSMTARYNRRFSPTTPANPEAPPATPAEAQPIVQANRLKARRERQPPAATVFPAIEDTQPNPMAGYVRREADKVAVKNEEDKAKEIEDSLSFD